MSIRRVSRQWALALAAAGAGATVAGIAAAAIPDANGVIHACIQTGGSAPQPNVRIIDSASESCAQSETPLQWNQQGPVGPRGADGPTGQSGPRVIAFLKTISKDVSSPAAATPLAQFKVPAGGFRLTVDGTAEMRPAIQRTGKRKFGARFGTAECKLVVDDLTTSTEVGETGLLLPAVQKVREAAARSRRHEPFKLELVGVAPAETTGVVTCAYTSARVSGLRTLMNMTIQHEPVGQVLALEGTG